MLEAGAVTQRAVLVMQVAVVLAAAAAAMELLVAQILAAQAAAILALVVQVLSSSAMQAQHKEEQAVL